MLPCYHNLREVFSKSKAMSLPPHRPDPWLHCPYGPPTLSLGARKSGCDRIHRDLTEGGVYLPLFISCFVAKKDGSLRPCIDYSPLNDITIKNRYPLPLMSLVFDLLQQAKICTNLDLRNTFHVVRIRMTGKWGSIHPMNILSI